MEDIGYPISSILAIEALLYSKGMDSLKDYQNYKNMTNGSNDRLSNVIKLSEWVSINQDLIYSSNFQRSKSVTGHRGTQLFK